MRLINTETLRLEDFPSEEGLQYAILSHRWEEGEVLFHDMVRNPDVSSLPGYEKISKCCAVAAANQFSYVWVDTCCIDKSSSAELQEAINSMFRWYRNSAVCYAYLSDVFSHLDEDFRRSQWFERGWTLQELIAPKKVLFFDGDWDPIGSRLSRLVVLQSLTRIPELLLKGQNQDLSQYCIATKMSWARGRKTTRLEDRAYSLLGIFGVSMPMLYGEGDNAFIRLQEEILRKSIDQSILAWTGIENNSHGILADSPDRFPERSAEADWQHTLVFDRRGPHTLTNEGLNLEMKLIPWKPLLYLALFNYRLGTSATRIERRQFSKLEGIFLKRLKSDHYYTRVAEKYYTDLYRSKEYEPADSNVDTNITLHCDMIQPKFEKPNESSTMFSENDSRQIRITIVRNIASLSEQRRFRRQPYAGYRVELDQFWLIGKPVQKLDHRICALEPGKSGPVGAFTLRGSMQQLIEGVLLGFDFDYCPVIVIHLANVPADHIAKGIASSQTSQGDNVRLKSLQQITCMEPDGWILMSADCHGHLFDLLNPQNQHFHAPHLPFKLALGQAQQGTFKYYFRARSTISGDKTISVALSRHLTQEPWSINIKERLSTRGLSLFEYKCRWLPPYGKRSSSSSASPVRSASSAEPENE